MNDSKPKDENRALNKAETTHRAFAGKKARIFNSFKEQEEEMIEHWASITPLQRLAHLYEMIKISFGITEEEARSLHRYKKITITKYNHSYFPKRTSGNISL